MENNQGGQGNYNACQVCGAGGNGRCGACGMKNNYFGNHVLRWILGIIIISWVFSIGMKLGEFKAMIENASPYGGYNTFYRATPMMEGFSSGSAMMAPQEGNVTFTTSSVPATAVKSGTIQIIKSN